MKLVFHGKLRDLYGESFEIQAETPADAVEGFFSQQPDHPRDMLIEIVGFETPEKLIAPTTEDIHLLPAMYGGGGNIGKIVLGAALIAVPFIGPTLGIKALAGGLLKTMFISMGVSLAMQGVMGFFMKSPTVSKDNDPPASKYIGSVQNTTEHGTPKTIACGRTLIGGHWLSLQIDADKIAIGSFPATTS